MLYHYRVSAGGGEVDKNTAKTEEKTAALLEVGEPQEPRWLKYETTYEIYAQAQLKTHDV